MNTEKLYRQLVLEASKSPKYRGKIEGVKPLEGKNLTCGDKLDLYLKIENNKITGAKFDGSGCAISMASAHILCDSIIGKTINEAEKIIKSHLDILKNPKTPKTSSETFMESFSNLPARVNCARLAWDTAKSVLR